MPKPRKTTAQLALSGTLKAHPGRYRERRHEPVVTSPIGPPPSALSQEAASVWNHLSEAANWLTAADRHMLEIAVTLFSDFRAGETRRTGQLVTALSKLGFTPADRVRVGAPGAEMVIKDEFAEFR